MVNLSPSTLNLFLDCPACFWLKFNKKVNRPQGIFPSLPGGMDNVIKKYFDQHRVAGTLPPELNGKIPGQLLKDTELIKKWRNWRNTDLIYTDSSLNVQLSGAIDECVILDDGSYSPVDYKTRGWPVKEGGSAVYQNQLDCYGLLFASKGYKVANSGYLIYYIPSNVSNNGIIQFNIDVVEMPINIVDAKKTIENAVTCLNSNIPDASPECVYCKYLEQMAQI